MTQEFVHHKNLFISSTKVKTNSDKQKVFLMDPYSKNILKEMSEKNEKMNYLKGDSKALSFII